MDKMKIGVVVLNYCTEKYTSDCVNSFLEKANRPISIIIVDNGSVDDSGKSLFAKYKENSQVSVICNETNLGFSKGMNVGYLYAKNTLGCDFIILSNSDITMLTDNFDRVIISDYEKYRFAVLGPKIDNVNKGRDESNPYYNEMLSEQAKYNLTRKKLFLRRVRLAFAYVHAETIFDATRNRLSRLKRKISSKYYWNKESEALKKKKSDDVVCDVALHGSIWIFSPNYVKEFDGLDELTFAYQEEWLLYYRCKRNRLLVMYEPRINVQHLGGCTVGKLDKNSRKSDIVRMRMQNASDVALLSYLKKIVQRN